ncbi:MAG TPA: hypothetical protein DDZ80_22850 [Cyanobacteria bacterium UBA8803]|nr:hypothetical protein [Cyanobacteria bacterium UBA9273]HBL61166.1 hypothetical protein [Cyanobacteria bacterium UBA8803]
MIDLLNNLFNNLKKVTKNLEAILEPRQKYHLEKFPLLKSQDLSLQQEPDYQLAEQLSIERLEIPETPASTSPELIDVKELIKQLSVEELCQTAEDYFARLTDWNYHLSKPFASINETPELLLGFSQVLQGLQILPGMAVLDFGAGSCWISRYLTQLGCHVIALDVSPSALKMGQELYHRQPVIGDRPPPQFLQFNGYQINLPDESVDRIICLDAFHHVPNPDCVLSELCRILKQGGIAGFSEPGEYHSQSPQSQHEMRNFKVIENDIDVKEIWGYAQKIGFAKLELAIFNALPLQVNLEKFADFLQGGETIDNYIQATLNSMENRRVFFLHKGDAPIPDSRQRAGLAAQLDIKAYETKLKEGLSLRTDVTVTNIGNIVWLSTTAQVGAVNLGIHLLDKSGKQINYDYFRQALIPNEDRPILPKETLNFELQVPLPAKGSYILEFDLVSEGVCWFSLNGSLTTRIEIEVI